MSHSPIRFDTHGLPVGQHGQSMWRQVFASLNTQADETGWDQPSRLYAVSGPRAAAALLNSKGVTFDDLTVGSGEFSSGILVEPAGQFGEHPLDVLWCVDVPQEYAAVLLSCEGWTTPMPGRARTEVRIWTAVTRSGHVAGAVYEKTGEHASAVLDQNAADLVGGRVVSLLARTIGVTRAPGRNTTALTVREYLGVLLAAGTSDAAATALNDPELMRATASVPDVALVESPLGWSGRWRPSDGPAAVTVIALAVSLAARLTHLLVHAGGFATSAAAVTDIDAFVSRDGDALVSPTRMLEACREATSTLTWTDLATMEAWTPLLPPGSLPGPAGAVWAGERMLELLAADAAEDAIARSTAALEEFDKDSGLGFVIEDVRGMLGWQPGRSAA